jgi:Flp pilus assembly protein TadG
MRRRNRTTLRTRLRSERGTALAELAIVIPLVMVLLLGMIDFGKAFNTWIDEQHLANEGARLAAVNYAVGGCSNSNTNVCLAQYIQQGADSGELRSGRSADSYAPSQSATQVCISYPQNTANSPATRGLIGDPVQVTVSVDYKWLNYITGRLSLPGGTTPITGTATMRLDQPAPANAVNTRSCYP